jgi:uncharacterized protein
MMAGGIRDHIGGGFHRYSTDRVWLIPHFEKMLYDNALLARVYAEAYLVTKKNEYAEVVRETIGWIRTEMRSPEGGFFSAQDADTSEGEGIYYSWTPDEVVASVGVADGALFNRMYGVTKTGNFEGRTILHLDPNVTTPLNDREAAVRFKRVLYQKRLERPRPATDTKVLTSWNGLAISSLAFSSTVLDDPSIVKDAVGAARFILEKVSKGGRLQRRFAGGEAALDGTLEDYAFFAQGMIDLFEATSEPKWLEEAVKLTRAMADDYEDTEAGGFFLTLDAQPARLKEGYDGPTPSGNSVAALNLLRLSEITGNQEFRRKAEATMRSFGPDIDRNPAGHTLMLTGLDLLLNGVREVVISAPSAKAAAPMKKVVHSTFMPDRVVVVATTESYARLLRLTKLLEGRKPSSKARAFVCQDFACKLPADSQEAFRAQLLEQG